MQYFRQRKLLGFRTEYKYQKEEDRTYFKGKLRFHRKIKIFILLSRCPHQTVYTSSFKFDLVTRVWDCFLVEGWKATYRVMLSLLQYHQNTLLSLSFEEILAFFREISEKTDGAIIVDEAMKIPLRWSHILKYENEWNLQQR